MLGLPFSSKVDWFSFIISITKTASKKIETLINSLNFLSPEVALHLYKSAIRPCMQYCCHVWTVAPSCYLDMLDKLQKRVCRTVGLTLAVSIEPLCGCRNVGRLCQQFLSSYSLTLEFCACKMFSSDLWSK